MSIETTEKFFETIHSIMESYCEWNNIELNSNFLERKIMEELGEMFQNLLIWDKQSRPSKYGSKTKEDVEDEMADVLGVLVSLAKVRDMDIIAGIERKWFKYKNGRGPKK